MEYITLTAELKEKLKQRGVETLANPGFVLPDDTIFEPPCSIKWMALEQDCYLGSFSYAVSGYFNKVKIGRYVSIGEGVQMGRGDHAISWTSSSPSFYLNEKLFDVGVDFLGGDEFDRYRPEIKNVEPHSGGSRIIVEHDVWIGHNAYIRPGVTIGTGAIVGAQAVVTRNVPPYAVVVGNPGRVVKYRFAHDLIAELLDIAWWRLAPWQLANIDMSRPQLSAHLLRQRVQHTPAYDPTPFCLHDIC